MKKYQIGNFVKEMGVGADFLKFYEECGLLLPHRNEQSGYRYYDIYDGGRLVSCKTYRNLNFTVQETAKAFHDMDIAELYTALEEKQRAFALERQRIERLTSVLEEYLSMQDWFAHPAAHIRVEELPGYYYLAQSKNEEFVQKKAHREIAATLLDMLPFSERLLLSPRSAAAGEAPFVYYWGMGIREDRAEAIFRETLDYLPPRRALRIPSRSPRAIPVNATAFHEPMQILREHGFSLQGDVIVKVPFGLQKNGTSCSPWITYLPV